MGLGRLVGALVLATLLAGCGFHPRGSAPLPTSLEALSVEAAQAHGPLADAMEAALHGAGVVMVDDPAHASARLKLSEPGFQRRVLSVDSSGHANEYELYYGLNFTLLNAAGDVLLPSQEVSVVREFAFDPGNVLASDQEEALIHDEMRRQAVEQLLRRLRRAPAQAPATAP